MLLANNLNQKRNQNQANRVENAIDNKGKKLNDINNAEENLNSIKENADNAMIENLSLKDQVNFSTVTLQLYQNEQLRTEMVVNEQNINAYRPNLGLQVWESLKTGWFIFEGIVAFLVQIWPLFLFVFLGWFGYKKVKSKKS
jgi:hypothetical protein